MPAPSQRARTALGAVVLAATQASLLVHTAWDKADTRDEPHYLASGVVLWNDPATFAACDSPALPKWGFALAVRLSDPEIFDPAAHTGRHPLWSRPLPVTRRNLLAARLATICVTVAAGLLLFVVGRRWGSGTALLSQALWCFSPTVLANGSLATLDGWAAALLAGVLWAAVRAIERPTLGRAAALGLALALAAGCKVTTLAVAPLAMGAWAWALWRDGRGGERSRLPRLLAAFGLVAVIVLLVLAALHGFRLGVVDLGNPCHRPGLASGRQLGPIPFAPWIAGVWQQIRHGQSGHLSYLFGEMRSSGWWAFYLVALTLKTTLGAQFLALLRLAAWLKTRPTASAVAIDAALCAYPAILVGVMSAGGTQNGIRYILPAFPFLALLGGRTLADAARAFGPWGRWLTLVALAGGFLEMLSVHPHHLMFFNRWIGGPTNGPRYLIHGDDWGQDQRRLAEWQRANHPWRLFYTRYTENPRHWGVSYEEPPCEPRPGYYALHAIEVHRPKYVRPGCLDWLTVEAPDERLGYSIYLYLVTKARIERLGAERDRVPPFWRSRSSVAESEAEGLEDGPSVTAP